MSKVEILQELPKLTPEDKEIAANSPSWMTTSGWTTTIR